MSHSTRWPHRPGRMDIQALIDRLDALPEPMRACEALTVAAAAIEYAAYEVVYSDDTDFVTQLISVAADMECGAMKMRTKTPPLH